MIRRVSWIRLAIALLALAVPVVAIAQDAPPTLADGVTEVIENASVDEVDSAVRLLVLLTSLTLIPAVLVLMTPFTRFVIVFSLLRQALGLQNAPPNQVLVGLAIMLSLVVMQPTLAQVQDEALNPYLEGQIGTIEAMERTVTPLRTFMLNNIERPDLAAALSIARIERPSTVEEIPTPVVVTAFVLSELRASFVIGLKVYLPFLVLDLIVSSILLGMGMMMIPPVVISMPFKLLLFVLMDGWGLLLTGLVAGYG